MEPGNGNSNASSSIGNINGNSNAGSNNSNGNSIGNANVGEYNEDAQAYVDRAQALRVRISDMIEDGDHQGLVALAEGINDLGHAIYGPQPPAGSFIEIAAGDIEDAVAVTRRGFRAMMYEEQGHLPDDETVAFSDEYRFSGVIHVDTMAVVRPADAGIDAPDLVYTWDKVQEFPVIMRDTKWVAVHFDNVEGTRITIPLPTPDQNQAGGSRARRRRRHTARRRRHTARRHHHTHTKKRRTVRRR